MAFLELLAAAARARIVAADAGIGIRDERGLGDPRTPPLDRGWGRLSARDEAIGGRF